MITVVKSANTGNNDKRTLINGVSTDEKPIENIKNGSMFVEIDTSNIYLFDEESKSWLLMSSGGGGGTGDVTKAYVDNQDRLIRADIATTNENVSALNDEVSDVKADLSLTNRNVNLLFKITQGQLWDFADQQESGTNIAPKGTQRQSLISVDGKSTQENTTGKNILPNNLDSYGVTNRGLTWTWVDNKICINGTYDGSGNNVTFDNYTTGTLKAGTYTVSIPIGWEKGIGVQIFFSDGSSQSISMSSSNNSKTIVIENDIEVLRWRLNIYSQIPMTTYNNYFIGLQLETGSTATAYEPYTGGIASPNPAYPQPITSVEQLNFKVTGRNLYNKDTYPLTFNYAITKSDGSVYATTSGNYYATRDFIPISGVHGKTLSGTPKMTVCFYDKDKVYISGAITGETGATSFVVPDNAEFIRFDTHKDYYEVVMIQLGTTPTDYEPYQEETHTITPPFALNKIGDYADFASIESGEWVKKINSFDYTATSVTAWSNIFDIRPAISGLARPFLMSDKFIGSDAEYNSNSEANAGMSSDTISPRFPTTDRLYYKGTATREELLETLTNATIYGVVEPTTEPIEATDLEYLKSLQNLDGDNVIIITDQNGNDISYLMKYLVKLSEAI